MRFSRRRHFDRHGDSVRFEPPMRVLHVVSEPGPAGRGVPQKVIRTVETWRRLGIDADFIDLSTGRVGAAELQTGDPFRPRFRAEWVLEMHRRAKRARRALAEIDADLVYTRELVWSPGLKSIFDDSRVVIEVNSDRGRELRSRSRPASVFWNLTAPGVRRRAAGIVAVTGELLERTRPNGVPGCVITNGASVPESPPEWIDRKARPMVLMLLGSAAPWHGLDRLSSLAEALPEFEFVVCGDLADEGPALSPLIRTEPAKTDDALAEILNQATVAVGSLAISRNGMEQACPLKSRTCLAAGLPLIYGYEDPDIEGRESFALRIRDADWATGNAVEQARHFIRRIHGEAACRRSAWQFAKKRFDHSVIERRRLDFFESILSGRDPTASSIN